MTLFNPVFNRQTPKGVKRLKTRADEGLGPQPKAGDSSRRSWLCRSVSAPSQQACEPVQDRCLGPCSRPGHAAAWQSRITLAQKKLIRTRRASEGSASEPSLARRVSMCKDAKLSCRGNKRAPAGWVAWATNAITEERAPRKSAKRPPDSVRWGNEALPKHVRPEPQSDPILRMGVTPERSQRGLPAATKLEDWIDYAIRSDCAPFSLAQFDNLAQKTRLSRLVVQREFQVGPSEASSQMQDRLIPRVNWRTLISFCSVVFLFPVFFFR